MPAPGKSRTRTLRLGAAVSAVLATQTPAAVGATAGRPPYDLTVGADAVMPYVAIPWELAGHVGAAAVTLRNGGGAAQPMCRAFGAGYWLGFGIEETAGDTGPGIEARVPAAAGVAPAAPDVAAMPAGVYRNPTASYRVNPDPGARRDWSGGTLPSTRDPGVQLGAEPGQSIAVPMPSFPAGPAWVATCGRPTAGSATSRAVQVPGVGFAQGTSAGTVDRLTGTFTGTARAAVSDLRTAGGGIAAITALLSVRVAPGREPAVSYRLSVFSGRAAGAATALSEQEVVVAGTDVPASALPAQFNEAFAALGGTTSALAPAGLQLVAPVVGRDARGRLRILAPAVAAHAGLPGREQGIGADQGVRLGTTYLLAGRPA